MTATIKLLLRRSVQVTVRYSTIASQFTQREAKGHSLVRPVILFGNYAVHPLQGRGRGNLGMEAGARCGYKQPATKNDKHYA